MNEDTGDEFDNGGPVKFIMLDGHTGTGKKMDTKNLVYTLVNGSFDRSISRILKSF